MTNRNVTQQDIQAAIRELGLSGRPLCVHSSLRSFGWVDGGADTVIDALLAEGCTVLAPTMSWHFEVGPPAHLRPVRNGRDYEKWDREHPDGAGRDASLIYTPESNEISAKWMGAIPVVLLQRPDRQRGNDPMGSFSAVGPLARELVHEQTARDPFAQFRALAEHSGSVVLMGVGLDRLTLLHQAEELAGRNLFMRWANDANGVPAPVYRGGCSAGFTRLEPFLAHLIRETTVGVSLWKVLPVRETVGAASEVIRNRPEITHCDDPECRDCNDAVLGGPILDGF
ncbi:MAG: aminoglycoside N(3)-acetyltransferase [Dehalococcoidia bacterium]|nr:aminoglycoside N(3)-acetyltransferase [Dehalococcoidia bacterium]